MGADAISPQYLSTGANRCTPGADWSRDGLVAFGADSNIALWEPAADPPRGVTRLLNGHSGPVRAVSFLPGAEGDESVYLCTSSEDKTLIVWRAPANSQDFETIQTTPQLDGPVNCIAVLRIPASQPRWILATGGSDATIRIWSFYDNNLELLQLIKATPKYFPNWLSLSTLDPQGDLLILAAAGTGKNIQIFTADIKAEHLQFDIQATLPGHENWIRSLSFARESNDQGSDLLLASASQDKYIRIWRVHEGSELPALAAEGADPLRDAYLPGRSPSNKAHKLKPAGREFSVTFEALLLGHEDWIHTATWHTHADGKLQILSSSMDNSLTIWEADPDSGIWVSTVRLGEISREKGATTATGSTGGFYTGLWSPDGKSVICLGRTGSWRRWQYDESTDVWVPCVPVTGHTKAVTGISWSPNGEYLVSTSLDQTTRLHAKWSAAGASTWHEMSRPQIHGYDLNCIDSLGPSQFVSGADEKLMRVFSEPKAVAAMLNRLCGIGNADVSGMPEAANMPVLGLSNKAVDLVDDDQEIQPVDDRDREAMDPASVVKKSHLDIEHPPHEETLSRHTLWPETEKLYGHGYELSSLAASHDGKVIASACKASSTNHAVIRLFETERWTEVKPPLTAHSLTATRLRFSADDKYLLSVGRDRQWAAFERDPEDAVRYSPVQSNPKGHARMILDAAWAPSEKPMFATAGRDKEVRIWAAAAEGDEAGKLQFAQVKSIKCEGPVTAVDFLPQTVGGRYILSVGTEAGRVGVYVVGQDSEVVGLPSSRELALPRAVLQLAWRPRAPDDSGSHELAVAGEDTSLRILAFSEEYLKGVGS